MVCLIKQRFIEMVISIFGSIHDRLKLFLDKLHGYIFFFKILGLIDSIDFIIIRILKFLEPLLN